MKGTNRFRKRPLLGAAVLVGALAVGIASATVIYPGCIVVKKFYDANANGMRDTGEPWLSGWRITLTRPNGSTSVRNTTATWTGLAPGSGYSVAETMPIESNWFQSAPRVNGAPVNPVSVRVYSGKTTYVKFGNYCKKGSGGRTPGYWGNNNGFNRMMDGGELTSELGLLSSLNLVDANGNAFDPGTYPSLDAWLASANATNMSYQLSRHLAAMALNVESNLVNEDSFFLPCNCTIEELMDDANLALGADGFTPAGDPNRATQETLKNWLDQLNNGALVVSPTPCRRTFPPLY